MRPVPSRALVTTCVLVVLAILGCSGDGVGPVDGTPPSVELLFPVSEGPQGANVLDSVAVVAHADDASGIAAVEFWCLIHGRDTADLIGVAALPDGGCLYSYKWDVSKQVCCSATGLLRAKAVDTFGNFAWTNPPLPMTILAGSCCSPDARFTIAPYPEGSVSQPFLFDASNSTDSFAPPESLLVRWDFDGDGSWDIDTTQGLRATDTIAHTYSRPDTYAVTLEVFSRLFCLSGRKTRELAVTP